MRIDGKDLVTKTVAEEDEEIQETFGADRITGIVGNDGGSEEGAALRRGWMERGRRVSGQVSETVDQLARLSRNIQQAVLETRMIPIGPLFNRFRRTVRDIAVKQGKPVSLIFTVPWVSAVIT